MDKGTFIQGSSNAEISFSLGNPSVNVAVSVKSSSGSVVDKKTIKSCKANKTYNVVWNGKRNGKAVAPGTYTAVVKAGSIQKSSQGLIVRKNEFAGGTGSKTNPFQVATLKQFLAVAKYNGCYFKQTANIDGKGVEKISGIYSEDNPFNGTYDGNGFVIKNIIMQDSSKENMALFGGVGEKGTLKKITLEKVDLIGKQRNGILFYTNHGKVSHCVVKDCYMTGSDCGGMLGFNKNEKGTVTNCTVTGGNIHLTHYGNGDVYSSALLVDNHGSFMDSKASSVSMLGSVSWGYVRSAGVVRWNTGKTSNCGALNCSMEAETVSDVNCRVHEERTAGICELNEGNISNCYSSGCTAKANGVYENKGIVR